MRRPGHRRARGVGLIEVLVAVALLAIGFLATAHMQVEGLRSSMGSYHDAQARLLAGEMADRMRINVPGARQGLYDNKSTAGAQGAGAACTVSGCTPVSLAAKDLADWRDRLTPPDAGGASVPVLPSSEGIEATGQILARGDGAYTVRMTWSEQVGGEHVARTFDLDFAL